MLPVIHVLEKLWNILMDSLPLKTHLVLIPQSPILLEVKSCLNSAATWISFFPFPGLNSTFSAGFWEEPEPER